MRPYRPGPPAPVPGFLADPLTLGNSLTLQHAAHVEHGQTTAERTAPAGAPGPIAVASARHCRRGTSAAGLPDVHPRRQGLAAIRAHTSRCGTRIPAIARWIA